jgi:amidase
MAQSDLRDPACVPAPFAREAPLARDVTLGVFRGGDGTPVEGPHAAALDAAAEWLLDAGFSVEEVELPHLAEAHRLWVLLLYEDLRPLLPLIRTLGDAAINASIDRGYEVLEELWGAPGLETYLAGHVRRTALIAELQAILSRFPVIVMPASGTLAPDHDADLRAETAAALMAAQWPNTVVPLLGLPGLTLPTGIEDGLPTGVQLLGGRFRESWLLDVAEVIEARAPQLVPIDPVGV